MKKQVKKSTIFAPKGQHKIAAGFNRRFGTEKPIRPEGATQIVFNPKKICHRKRLCVTLTGQKRSTIPCPAVKTAGYHEGKKHGKSIK